MDDQVQTLAVYENQLFAGGKFTTSGDEPVNYIAAWDGDSWSALGSGMNDEVLSLITYNDKLIVGGKFTTAGNKITAGIAAWTSPPIEVPTDTCFNTLPEAFSLSQNYPNPFNSCTIIQYFLPRTCQVRLEIFNILGQKVKELISESLDSGYHTIHWDGRDQNGQVLASGVYFYRLQADGTNLTRKMAILR